MKNNTNANKNKKKEYVEKIILSAKDAEFIIDALLNPYEPSEDLKKLMKD